MEENQRAALAGIVHGILRLDAEALWTYSTRFDFALDFYSFVADNYAPFYTRPVECTDRDAPFVLDGVLYHESDLDLEEH